MYKNSFFLLFLWITLSCCGNSNVQASKPVKAPAKAAADTMQQKQGAPVVNRNTAQVDSVLQLGEVPILCYHQVRDWTGKDGKTGKVYIVPVANFKEQMKALHDSGYHTILPDQLLAHLEHGAPLPEKPVMLSFDDADGSQITTALPELDKYGFKGVFYIMTVVLNRPNYMTRDQVKDLYAHGHTIGCHTWDHHMVTKYKDPDWVKQIEKPNAELEKIIGQPVKYFAYPFGLWNDNAVVHIKKYGFTAAFQLSSKADHNEPLMTIRRQIVDGNWNLQRFQKTIARKTPGATAPAH